MKRRAFTLIELLVVVAIIGVLIAILIPSLGKAREMTQRSTCAANLKGQGEAFAIYANQFTDKLPLISTSTPPAFDTASKNLNENSVKWCNELLSMPGGTGSVGPKWFFCPANNTGVTGVSGTLGYTYLNLRGPSNDLTYPGLPAASYGLPQIQPAWRTSPPLSYHDKWNTTPFANTSELALDLIINTGSTTDFSANVTIGGIALSSNHMASDAYPRGANVLYFDGHVKFQLFSGPTAPVAPMTIADPQRRAAVKMTGSTTVFYFPEP